jgi:hypothetical protein
MALRDGDRVRGKIVCIVMARALKKSAGNLNFKAA